jgi:hypothetical protein
MISDYYKNQIRGLHESKSTWGNGPRGHILRICKWVYENKVRDLLDYGCGKGKNMPFILPVKITNYDPGVAEWESDPKVCEHLMCLDVLEHIEPMYIGDVLEHISSKFTKSAMLTIALTPSKDILPDGKNAHILLRPSSWWVDTLEAYVTLQSMEFNTSSITVFVTPKQK